MEKFSKTYKEIKPSIVAIASLVSSYPQFDTTIGTGFIARSDGVIFTNNHVIEAIKTLPRLKAEPEKWPAKVLYFHFREDKGMSVVPFEIDGVGILHGKLTEGENYGPDLPDIGYIQVKMKDLPALKISSQLDLNEGDEIMVAGFPMGTDTLRAPGWIHQLGPTLQSGIISALLPFPCNNPHAMILNVMTHGGSSGSPIFNPSNGEVIGILYGGIIEPKDLRFNKISLPYINNTSLTTAIPAKIIDLVYRSIDTSRQERCPDTNQFDTIESLLEKLGYQHVTPKSPPVGRDVSTDDLIFP